jgi:hypothetical protein
MEKSREQLPEELRELQDPRNHHRSHLEFKNDHHQQFHQNNNKGIEKKSSSRNKRYNKNRNYNRSYNKYPSDGSVSTNSSGEGSTNSTNMLRSQSKGWNKSNKSNKNSNRNYNHFSSPKNSAENSKALNSYLRERGWSLSDDLNLSNNFKSDNGGSTTTTITYSATNAPTVFRESELARKRALKLLEITLCRWAASIEKNPIAWQQVRGTYRTVFFIRFQTGSTPAFWSRDGKPPSLLNKPQLTIPFVSILFQYCFLFFNRYTQ